MQNHATPFYQGYLLRVLPFARSLARSSQSPALYRVLTLIICCPSSNHIENFLFKTSSARASSWNPIAANAPAGAAAAPVAPMRGLLVALPLPPLTAVGSSSEGVGCSSADKLALLLGAAAATVAAGGDCDIVLGGGVARSRCGTKGPGMLRPGPSGATGGSCANWWRGDSALTLTWARYGGELVWWCGW